MCDVYLKPLSLHIEIPLFMLRYMYMYRHAVYLSIDIALNSCIGGVTPGPAGAAPAGNAVPRLVPRLEKYCYFNIMTRLYKSAPHLQTIVPRLCPGLCQKMAPPVRLSHMEPVRYSIEDKTELQE